MKLRIGISPCPNDVFIYAGLILGRIPWVGMRLEFDFQDIQTLNLAANRGDYEAVKISFANYPHCAGGYRLLDCGGALGRRCGPLLLTGGNTFDFDREVLIPGENTTAHVLWNTYAGAEWPGGQAKKKFLPFDEIYRRLKADPSAQGVVIHEARFTYDHDGLALVRDLGEFWETQTHSPIPLGALVLSRHGEVEPGSMAQRVRASIRWAESNRDEALELCRRYAPSMGDEVLKSHISLYVNEFSSAWGREGRQAVEHFFQIIGFPYPADLA